MRHVRPPGGGRDSIGHPGTSEIAAFARATVIPFEHTAAWNVFGRLIPLAPFKHRGRSMPPVLQLPARPLTVDDLDDFPQGDGHRYELCEGTLIVRSSPSPLHQVASLNLMVELRLACVPELAVLPPINVGSRVTNFEPDVVVISRDSYEPTKRFGYVPVLVVEVRSPSTASIDRTLKRAAYAELGVQHYWMLDADAPGLQILELRGGAYVEVGTWHGDTDITVERPFRVTLNPARLVVL